MQRTVIKKYNSINYQLIIEKIPFSYKKKFWLKKYNEDFNELHVKRLKYSSYSQNKKDNCYELLDIKNHTEYTLYVTNDNYLLVTSMEHLFLKSNEVNKEIIDTNVFNPLPSNVYNIRHILYDKYNENILYVYGYKKYNNTFNVGENNYIFIKYDMNNKTKEEYVVVNQDLYLDGGTTNLCLKDDKDILHYYHWDSRLKNNENRHNVFDDFELIDIKPTKEIIDDFNKINENIILEL